MVVLRLQLRGAQLWFASGNIPEFQHRPERIPERRNLTLNTQSLTFQELHPVWRRRQGACQSASGEQTGARANAAPPWWAGLGQQFVGWAGQLEGEEEEREEAQALVVAPPPWLALCCAALNPSREQGLKEGRSFDC